MFRSPLLIISLLVASSCSRFSVKRDMSEGHSFSNLKTFNFIAVKENNLTRDTINGRRAIESLEGVLNQKGFTSTSTDKADFLIVLDYENVEFIQPRSSSVGIGVGSSSRGSVGGLGLGIGFGAGQRDERATLRIRFLDGTSNKEIWKGSASGDFEEDTPKETTKNFHDAVSEIMQKFP